MTTRNLKRLLLLRLSNLLSESAEWTEIGYLLDCENLIQNHPRLLRSRYNNDDDYPISFSDAGDMAGLIEEFGNISSGQANRILEVAILNGQVSGSFKAERIVRKLVNPHMPSIPKKTWAKFQQATGKEVLP
jgi:hypothetical protein